MSILSSVLNAQMMGEPQRLDYVIREHEKLERKVDALIELLVSKELLTRSEIERAVHATGEADAASS